MTSRKTRPGLTGIDIRADGVSVARVERAPGRPPALRAAEFRPWNGTESQQKVLTQLSDDYDLRRSRCTTVLGGADYALLLTEAPDVPSEELRAALRWRVKDLIDFHINDATLDVFEVPGEKPRGRARPMYVVAARTTAIQRRVNLLDAAGIGLDIIDIPELVQRNIAALLPQDAKGVVCVALAEDAGLVTITKQTEVYLTRNLDIGLHTFGASEDTGASFERLTLEIQRSLDYYDSHFRQAPVTDVVLLPMEHSVSGLAEHVHGTLGANVSTMDITEFMTCDISLDAETTARCLPAIGAALREEDVAL